MRKFIFILIFLLGLKVFAQTSLEPREYAIYSEVLNQWYSGSGCNMVIRKNTGVVLPPAVLEKQLRGVKNKLPQVKEETLLDFKAKNVHSYNLDDFFHLDKGYEITIVPQKMIDEIFKEGDWEEFYEEYPASRGIITFSRVGFDANREQALVQVSSQWEHSTGSSLYILFRFKNSLWKPEGSFRIWNSWVTDGI
ncbi:MAG: hypothetical protein GF375_05540 [Candidatus Omnitrophica bacterium]|nr:hypothetical protein [Candidatus Omnitrophota bacterium]MBD3269451.1 hypothetical protein [Candidatus Omnitrophota bacterium]